MKSLTFYTHPQSRGNTVRWMLEECGADYETVNLEFGPEMKSPEYLAINPNTIQRAYAQLEMEGYVYSVAGRGTFVAEGQEQNLVRRREVEAKVQPLVQELRELGMTEGEWIALWRGGNENA